MEESRPARGFNETTLRRYERWRKRENDRWTGEGWGEGDCGAPRETRAPRINAFSAVVAIVSRYAPRLTYNSCLNSPSLSKSAFADRRPRLSSSPIARPILERSSENSGNAKRSGRDLGANFRRRAKKRERKTRRVLSGGSRSWLAFFRVLGRAAAAIDSWPRR